MGPLGRCTIFPRACLAVQQKVPGTAGEDSAWEALEVQIGRLDWVAKPALETSPRDSGTNGCNHDPSNIDMLMCS